jgi:hypothetical protein
MATSTLSTVKKSPASKRRIAAYGAIFLFALALAWLLFNFSSIKGNAKLGTAYAAHIACSCRYIQGRELNSCIGDFEPGMELVSVSDDTDSKRITASVPFLAQAMAEYRKESGCQQLNEAEMDAVN